MFKDYFYVSITLKMFYVSITFTWIMWEMAAQCVKLIQFGEGIWSVSEVKSSDIVQCWCSLKLDKGFSKSKSIFPFLSLDFCVLLCIVIVIFSWEMLATHLLTHTFQHILFDWLKFTWNPQKVYRTHMIWWDPCEF